MDILQNNLTDETLSLVANSEFSKITKKALFTQNVILSFVGKVVIPKITIRADLPHRPVGIDVCVIVKDIKKTDYDASNIIWKLKWQQDTASSPDLSIPKVVFLPISELKLAYQSFEARRKLAATFDVFLADKRIVHHLPTNLGKAFYKSVDKVPIPVTIGAKNLVDSVNQGLKTCLVLLKESGTTQSVNVGNIDMPLNEIRENIVSVARGVMEKWPGGIKNLRSIYVRGVGPSVPLYYDNKNPSGEMAKENLAQVKGKKCDTEEQESTEMDRNASSKFITTQVMRSKSTLPISVLLEVAKSLPLSESQVAAVFSKKSKVATRKSIAKKSSRPLKLKGKQKIKK